MAACAEGEREGDVTGWGQGGLGIRTECLEARKLPFIHSYRPSFRAACPVCAQNQVRERRSRRGHREMRPVTASSPPGDF